MASIDYSATDELPQKSSGRVQPDVADLVGIARRGWFFMVAGTILGLLAAYAVLSNLASGLQGEFSNRVRTNAFEVPAIEQDHQRAVDRRLRTPWVRST